MQNRFVAFLILIGSILIGTGSAPSQQRRAGQAVEQLPRGASLIQLIASPEKYDGGKILVVGFLDLQFEGKALYVSEDAYRHHVPYNLIDIQYNEVVDSNCKALAGSYVVIAGDFRQTPQSDSVGYIENISRCSLWSATDDPRRR